MSVKKKQRLIKTVDKGVKKKCGIAKEFDIPPDTLSTILKNQNKYDTCRGLAV